MTDLSPIRRLIKSLQERGLMIDQSTIEEAISVENQHLRRAYDIGSLKAVDALFGHQSESFEQYYTRTYGNK